MAKVCGDADTVRTLRTYMDRTILDVLQQTIELDKHRIRIEGVWKDEGNTEVKETVALIKKAIRDSMDSVKNLRKALDAYANFLSKKNKS